MAGSFGVYREALVADTVIEDDGTVVAVAPGDRVFISVPAAKDSAHFPDSAIVNPRRALDSYIHYGAGPLESLGSDVGQIALVELFRALFRKKGLRRSAGPQGLLKKIPQAGGLSVYLTEDWGFTSPFPTTMKVTWDGA